VQRASLFRTHGRCEAFDSTVLDREMSDSAIQDFNGGGVIDSHTQAVGYDYRSPRATKGESEKVSGLVSNWEWSIRTNTTEWVNCRQ